MNTKGNNYMDFDIFTNSKKLLELQICLNLKLQKD